MMCRTASAGHIGRSIRPTTARAGFGATIVRVIARARRVHEARAMKKNPRTTKPSPSTPRPLAPAQLTAVTGGDRGGVIIQRPGGVIVE
jgi:hypothetical protein